MALDLKNKKTEKYPTHEIHVRYTFLLFVLSASSGKAGRDTIVLYKIVLEIAA